MDVVGHHAPRVDGHAGRGGVASEHVGSGAATAGQAMTGARPVTALGIEPIMLSSA